MSNLYRGPSIDAYYQVAVHLVPWKFLYKDCSFCPDSLTNMTCFGLVDFYKKIASESALSNEPKLRKMHLWKVVSVHWAKHFQRRHFLEIDQSEKPIACSGHAFNEPEQDEHPL
jgi:hypothetical protein